MTTDRITVEALVNAPIDKAWRTFTTPEHITQWNYASDEWCCPSAQVDPRKGGLYTARMEARDGSFGFDFTGTYEEFDPEERAILRMEDGRLAETTFDTEGDGTRVTTTFDADQTNPVDMQRDGWQAILNNYKTHTEKV